MTQMSSRLRLLQPVKAVIARGLCDPVVGSLIARAYSDLIPSHGLVFNTRSPLIADGTKAAIYWGLYERDELRFVSRYLGDHPTVVELGSSIGVVACHIRRKIGPTRRLICVEASPQLSELLARNLKLNGLDHNVTILNKAIAYSNEDDGEVAFELGRGSASGRISASAERRQLFEGWSAAAWNAPGARGHQRFLSGCRHRGRRGGIYLWRQRGAAWLPTDCDRAPRHDATTAWRCGSRTCPMRYWHSDSNPSQVTARSVSSKDDVPLRTGGRMVASDFVGMAHP